MAGIRDEIDVKCPLKDVKIKKQKDPWITNEILELINDKNDLLGETKRSQDTESWENVRAARNVAAALIKDAERNFLTNEIENNHDPAKFWKKLHTMFPDKPFHAKVNLVDPVDGCMIDEGAISGYANDFFTSIGSNIIQETGFEMDNWTCDGVCICNL